MQIERNLGEKYWLIFLEGCSIGMCILIRLHDSFMEVLVFVGVFVGLVFCFVLKFENSVISVDSNHVVEFF